MIKSYNVLCHNCIKIEANKIIYFDPFRIKEEFHDADYVFCTHSHYDHFSPEDIRKVMKENTKLIVTNDIIEKVLGLVGKENVITVEPNKEYEIDEIKFKTTYAYNQNKDFHKKENNWVGYIVDIEGQKVYVAGDTDNLEELRNIKCYIAFLPVGGTYTMNYKEAAELANCIDAKIKIPTHYGEIVGDKEDGEKFKKLLK